MGEVAKVTSPIDRRPWLGVGGLLGLVVVVGFVVGPVVQGSFVYGLRPADAAEDGSVVAALALARGVPDSVEVSVGCAEGGSRFGSLSVGLWGSPVAGGSGEDHLQILSNYVSTPDSAALSIGGAVSG